MVTTLKAVKLSPVVVLIILQTVHSQMLFSGWCPHQDPIYYFDRYRYLGLWYEQQRYFTLFEAGGRCMTILHEDAGDGRFAVTNSMVDWFGKQVTASGFASIIDSKGPVGAKYNLRYYSNPLLELASKGDQEGNYWILDTDYDNYAIVWDCNDKLFSNTQFLWILTRKRHPQDWVVDRALWELERRGLDTSKLKTTDHTGCPPPFDFQELGYDAWNAVSAPPVAPYPALPDPALGTTPLLGYGAAQWPLLAYDMWGRLDGNSSFPQGNAVWNKSSVPQLAEHRTNDGYQTPLPVTNISRASTQSSPPKSSYYSTAHAYNKSRDAFSVNPLPATKFPNESDRKMRDPPNESYRKSYTSALFQDGWKASDYHQVLQLRSFQ